jgi:signal transduction histidine kinase
METSTESVLTEAVLRRSALLASCSQVEIDAVLSTASEQRLQEDEVLFEEQDSLDSVWIIAEGELEVVKRFNGEDVIGREEAGAFLGEIPVLTHEKAYVKVKAVVPTRLVRIPERTFRSLMASCPTVSAAVMRSLVDRVRRYTILLQEREKMAGLGTLAAGLAHELNNPASAATRAVMQAEEIMDAYRSLGRRLVKRTWTDAGLNLVESLDDDASLYATQTRDVIANLDPVERTDREDALATWLSDHNVPDAWECAPSLVEAGFTPERLSELAEGVNSDELQSALEWGEANARLRQLLSEIRQSTGRISELVAAVKGYSHADRVTPKIADVHMAIENTLTMLGYKLRAANIRVDREYDRTLPKIKTFGAELHQVWTNLIDNAIDAINGDKARTKPGGTIRVRTSRNGNCAQVDVIDDGPGISPAALPRLFEAFFTTKEVGQGTGLGLEIVRRIVTRHEGSVSVSPEPGATTFTVRLPLASDEARS